MHIQQFSSPRTRSVQVFTRLSRNVFQHLWLSCEFNPLGNRCGLLRPGTYYYRVEAAHWIVFGVGIHGLRLHGRIVSRSLLDNLRWIVHLRGWLRVHFMPDIRCFKGRGYLSIRPYKNRKLSENNFQLKPFPVLCWVALSSYHLIDFILMFTPYYGHPVKLSDVPLFMWCDICKANLNFRPF